MLRPYTAPQRHQVFTSRHSIYRKTRGPAAPLWEPQVFPLAGHFSPGATALIGPKPPHCLGF